MKSILITGGAGYFGRAFTKFLLSESDLERICIYSRDEAKHAAMREQFLNDERLRFFVGDVRDQQRLWRAMDGVDVVVHAAALKRVEVCEYDPGEVAKTNVMGSVNLIEAAMLTGVRKVVALSTDKACDPINAYGASKLLMEKLFLAANNASGANGTRFAVTRYGNVAGSTGSVIPYWRSLLHGLLPDVPQILPVTHPEATRFWMTVDEAVELVWRTIETMEGGELNIPVLPAYRVGDLCEAMGATPHYIGLRPGEKLHESMDEDKHSDRAIILTVKQLHQALKLV